ncbi:MAG: tRNA uridine-5-carboxymethylaminomethyl(34) synthesis GTPase MnmE, partial [Aestuariivirgaceae bacterium]|nr:tRNA uridine-5-carboxymethylaminomethyl(34) synthesis GTPase MnmE [Aestuariivirgaceae bacterium]
GRAVVEAVLADLSARGLRAAEAGEFSRRAFLNGKIDLVEVEGLGDLLAARTEGQRRQALRQLEGENSRVFEGWRHRLVRVLAHAEAMIDFSDEADVAVAALSPLFQDILTLRGEIASTLARAKRGERMRDGARVVLAGAPNAGKSSLFNALVQRDAAMVSDIPGTTRDVIEVFLDIGGVPVVLADTAGLRDETSDLLEAEGMRRSMARMDSADVVLWVGAVDAQARPGVLDSEPIYIWNKADLAAAPVDGVDWIPVCARSGAGLADVERALAERLQSGAAEEDVLITRERHRQALERTVFWLDEALAVKAEQPELLAEALRQAAVSLGRLTGRVDVEDLLDVIFRDFCIGK